MTTFPLTGTVLFAHGSRDPLWRAPIEAVQTYIQTHNPQVPVRCAYLELSTPDLGQAVQELIDIGTRAITMAPISLGTANHDREVLPVLLEDLRMRHPHVHFNTQAPIGEDPRMTALMASIACGEEAIVR